MCFQLVKENWDDNVCGDIQQKLRNFEEILRGWGKETTSNFGGKIKEYKVELKNYRGDKDEFSIQMYEEAICKLHKVLD